MKTKELVMGTSYGVFLALALFTILVTLPTTARAHDGVEHSTAGEARAHLLETARAQGLRASTTIDATCMAAAVETRETALATAWGELTSGISSALSDRKTALIAAWNMSSATERTAALKTAWKEWKADKKALHTEFRKDRKAAWDAFKKTAKDSCKVTVPKDEALEKTEKDAVSV
jgi:hypothetical protein